MTTGREHATAAYHALRQLSERHAKIRIIEVQGEPPEYFVIEYLVKGYALMADGTIGHSQSHRISLSLPFGYPQTPPICKPLTPIFHPNVEKHNILVAHFWAKKHSFPDLILYLGRLICAEIYTTTISTNPQASQWYEEHRAELPLDSLTGPQPVPASAGPRAEQAPAACPFSGSASLSPEVASPADLPPAAVVAPEPAQFRAPNFELELRAAFPVDEEKPPEPPAQSQLAHIREEITSCLKAKKIFLAQRLLYNLGAGEIFPEREKLAETIVKAIEQANELHAQLVELEDHGQHEQALELTRKLAAIAADFPGLKEIQQRLKHSLDVSRTFSELSEQKKASAPGRKPKSTAKNAKSEPEPETEPKTAAKKSSRARLFLDLPYLRILLVSTTLVTMGASAVVLFLETKSLGQARTHYLEAEKLIKQHKFQQASNSLDRATSCLSDIRLLTYKKSDLEEKLASRRKTKEFTEGIQGRILWHGEYIPLILAEKLQTFDDLVAEADAASAGGRSEEAIRGYQKAHLYATGNGLNAHLRELQQKINILTLQQTMTLAKNAEAKNQWSTAADIYQQALSLSRDIAPQHSGQIAPTISQHLALSTFREKISQARETFVAEDWPRTLTLLEEAQHALLSAPAAATAVQKRELRLLLSHARLYFRLSAAKKAYEQGVWDLAIANYQEVLRLLNTEGESFSDDIIGSLKQINRILLVAKTAKELTEASAAEKELDYSDAVAHYRSVVNLINKSNFRRDKEIAQLLADTTARISAADRQLEIHDKIEWLTKRYEVIFRQYYPSSKNAQLGKPRVFFVKEIDRGMIFQLSCDEESGGNGAHLVLNYEYRRDTGRWNLYAGKL